MVRYQERMSTMPGFKSRRSLVIKENIVGIALCNSVVNGTRISHLVTMMVPLLVITLINEPLKLSSCLYHLEHGLLCQLDDLRWIFIEF